MQHGVPVLLEVSARQFPGFQGFECVESLGDPLLVILG